jgi:segregation and condensation protein B
VQKLLEKELIVISGRNEKLPGHPLIYATSKNFMDYFGINSPEDLPKIREVLAEHLVEPTIINRTEFEQSDVLSVSDAGELVLADAETEEQTPVNGHSFDMAPEIGNAPFSVDAGDPIPEKDSVSETLADEIAKEEYISDEIFAAEDEAIEEQKIGEELAADALFPGAMDQTDDDEENEASDDKTDTGL